VTAFESLAREHDFTLVTNVLRGCSWESGLSPRCTAEQDEFYQDVLPALDVDVVVAVSLSRAEPMWQDTYASPDRPPGETLAQLHLRTASATVDLVHQAGAKIIIVKALLGTNGYDKEGPDPLDCLARASQLGDCALVPPLESRSPTASSTPSPPSRRTARPPSTSTRCSARTSRSAGRSSTTRSSGRTPTTSPGRSWTTSARRSGPG
jgi:hypothetical protein